MEKWKDLQIIVRVQLTLVITEAVWTCNFNLSSILMPTSLIGSLEYYIHHNCEVAFWNIETKLPFICQVTKLLVWLMEICTVMNCMEHCKIISKLKNGTIDFWSYVYHLAT